jgi:hypothetical protein
MQTFKRRGWLNVFAASNGPRATIIFGSEIFDGSAQAHAEVLEYEQQGMRCIATVRVDLDDAGVRLEDLRAPLSRWQRLRHRWRVALLD